MPTQLALDGRFQSFTQFVLACIGKTVWRQFAYGGCADHVPFARMKACVATCGGQASSR